MDKLKDLKFSLGSWNKVSLFLIFKKIKEEQQITAGLIEVEFKSKRSAWAERVEALPWVPAPVERAAAAALLALRVEGIFSVVKLLPHFCKKKPHSEARYWLRWGTADVTFQSSKQLCLILKSGLSHAHPDGTLEKHQSQRRGWGPRWKMVATEIQAPKSSLLTRSSPRKRFSGKNE